MLENIREEKNLDALLVLGRGIDQTGVLSETSQARVMMAVDIARIVLPRVVVFSGGHSWIQEREGVAVPAEGEEMLRVGQIRAQELGLDIALLAETESVSTVENLVNSKPILDLSEKEVLGVLTDELHNRNGRVKFLSQLVFPKQEVHILDIVPNQPQKGAESEERLATLMTKFFMLGVRSGHDREIMRRQRLLEWSNKSYRTISSIGER